MLDDPKPIEQMTDAEVLAEWECIDCESVDDKARSDALADALRDRHIDF